MVSNFHMSDDGHTRITLRIPDTLHEMLSREASRTSKSLNAEIVGRLMETFAMGHGDTDASLSDERVGGVLLDALFEALKRAEAMAKEPQRDPSVKTIGFLINGLSASMGTRNDVAPAIAKSAEVTHLKKNAR